MSGHSKWANIKNRKGAQDKKRSEAFTRVSKNIMTAIREGGGNCNPESNISLREAIDRSRAVNMPKENIDRLLKRFEERKNSVTYGVFEGFGPFGVPMMIEVETDNKNRILGEIKLIFRNYGGNLGESGSVAFMFDKVGEIEVESKIDENLELELIDSGVKDIEGKVVTTEVTDFGRVRNKIREMGLAIEDSGLVFRCRGNTVLESEEEVGKILDMIDELEENDDVVNVFAGFDYAKKT
ncbi:MAG TPA: YebC/PmpR family DNA-binding transcriptional regulator [Candidatus Methanoperedens sp.]|nr:YebC/PmpR family DNA-binding transcriptional regulator [Candidatus Methanoperedens sp.]